MTYSKYPNTALIPVTNSDLSSGVGGIYKGSGTILSSTSVTLEQIYKK